MPPRLPASRPGILLSAGIALALSPSARASAYYFSDVGVRSFSRAGAFVAGADDITALYYNPAAVIRLDPQINIHVAAVSQSVTFDRTDYPGEGVDGDLVNDPIENEAPPYVIPHFGVALTPGLPDTTLAIGFYPPYAPDYAYPADGAQRYSLVDTVVIQTSFGPTLAHRFGDWVTVGAGLAWSWMYVEQELAVTLSTNTDTERDEYDVGFGVKASDPFTLTGNLGVLLEPPTGQWSAGFMVQPPVHFDATGSMEASFLGNAYYEELGIIAESTTSDEDISLSVTMPLILKAGFALHPTEQWEAELAAVWQGWGVVEDIVITDMDMTIVLSDSVKDSGLVEGDALIDDDIILPADYQDSWSLRLGGHYKVNDEWTVRA
ncbi:MAG: outer membrane protein transport protein, partial [Myxococcota bacterium]|nr:outer membrane protein transport protein [Myxococcota bacterium]